MTLRLLLTFLLVGKVLTLPAQDTIQSKKFKVFPVPAFGYSPETRAYIGGVALCTFRLYPETRTSNAKVELNYTWNKQIILESEWNYFSKAEKWFTKGRLHYSRFPDLYYGIGSETPDAAKLSYNSHRVILESHLLKKVGEQLFTGINAKYTNFGQVRPAKDTLAFPELTSSAIAGIGYALLKDTRNSILSPNSGKYAYFNVGYSFLSHQYWDITLDLRYYRTWYDKFTWATRFYQDFNIGNAPFYEQAFLGGDKLVRGYYYGRYRDKNLATLQTECRFPLFWRIGLAVFGGLSSVYPSEQSRILQRTKYNAGVGLRFLVDKKDKINLRIDYARGQGTNSGFYIAFGESF